VGVDLLAGALGVNNAGGTSGVGTVGDVSGWVGADRAADNVD
jgi:hypothetical protein